MFTPHFYFANGGSSDAKSATRASELMIKKIKNLNTN